MKSNIYIRKYLFLLVSLIFIHFIAPSKAGSSNLVKVGVYQNAPLTVVEKNKNPKGFFIDILEHIASEKGWEIEYVPGSLPECLSNLEKGDIDLLGGITYSETRGRIFNYSIESVITNWGQIYLNKKSDIESIIDFKGKKIAVLHNDIYFLNLRKLVSQSGIKCRFIEAFEYEDVLELVERGRCEAGLVSQNYGIQREKDYNIIKSSIILSPQKLYWAAPKGKSQELLHILDSHIRKLKNNHQSIYYESLANWFGIGEKSKFEKWFKWVISSFAVLLILFFTVSLTLRVQVKSKTNELLIKNKELNKEIKYRKEAEGALKFTQFAVDHSSDAAFWIGSDARFAYVNEAACRFLGYSKDELLTMTVHDIDPDFPKEIWAEHWAGLKHRGSHVIESHHHNKAGDIFPVEISVNYVEFEGNEYHCAFARNISFRKRAEKALRESEEKYRTVLEANPDPVVVYDMEGKVIYFNPAFTRVFGWDLEERLGKKMDLFVPEDAWRETKMMIEKVLAGERFSGIETKRFNKNGKIVPVNISGAIYKDQNGKPIGSVINLRDITEHKRIEAQLQQALKMESIGTLAGGIAHDFNNILGIIIGNAELALDDIPEKERARFNLEEIREAGQRAKDVVKQLLSFARKTELEQKPIKLIPVVKDSIRLLRATIPVNIDIRQNIDITFDTISADSTQIHQLMLNLCTNATHAMEDTGGILEIGIKNVVLDEVSAALYPDFAAGEYINLTISDTGPGISPEIRERIFDPYFTTKEVGKGTGMGLSVVHGIVKNYGGAVSVESELGKGTKFYIYFPVIEKESMIETKTVKELPRGNERILFVDDDKSIVYVGRYRLERLGYQVETKNNPVEALELFRTNPDQFDLIITDMAMPQMTGVQMMKEMLEIRPDMPIILCTGFSKKIDEKKAKEFGAAEYVEKPLDKHDFAFKVRKVLD
jgi:PAS domain S-box-containing protein